MGYPDGVRARAVYVGGVSILIVAVVGGNAEEVVIGVLGPDYYGRAVMSRDLLSVLVASVLSAVDYGNNARGACGFEAACDLEISHRQTLCARVGVVNVGFGELLSLLSEGYVEATVVLVECVCGVAVSVIVDDYGRAPRAAIPYGVAELSTVVDIVA